ncbi:hypothetical protein [Actinoalloteichus spitiensis]|uniref:hypothetical protein n=1 Tax=Actinoalloteichus spitiensis TaxID=252394 RepID=UPI001FDF45F0|nr:hypothetical protein [Actinoalloteichus spitiensis]
MTSLGHWPSRLAAGAFILNSGLSKRDADDEAAAGLHGAAAGAYPFLKSMDPKQFVRLLSTTEIGLGAALLIPLVPTGVAGLGLTAFSAGLVGMYLRTPGTHHEGSVRPTEQGLPLAKDVWLVGAGLGMVVEGVAHRAALRRHRRRKALLRAAGTTGHHGRRWHRGAGEEHGHDHHATRRHGHAKHDGCHHHLGRHGGRGRHDGTAARERHGHGVAGALRRKAHREH